MKSLGEPGSSCPPLSLRKSNLEYQARQFAGDLSELLNRTVTHGIRLRSYMDMRGRAVIGYKVNKFNPVGDCVPLTVSRSPAHLYLNILHTLELDNSGTFLATSKSTYTLQGDNETSSILTYDFVRKPPNEFPEAHIHLHGESDVLVGMLNASGREKSKTADLHLPVGGRRFRPCLEDIIEFCILERLITPRDSWKEALNTSGINTLTGSSKRQYVVTPPQQPLYFNTTAGK
ncbi:MAG: hypothetical protein OXI96_04790 [Acidimicrobiaceae bacterium]|nr:hypothetical protein [Acidimicrobiaceae bacterium]